MAVVTLEEQDYQDVLDVLEGYYAMHVPLKEVKAILDADNGAKLEIAHWGASDTEVRTTIINTFVRALEITRNSWPRNGDPILDKCRFWEKFLPAAQEKGWIKKEDFQNEFLLLAQAQQIRGNS